MADVLSKFQCGDILVLYVHDKERETVGVQIIPSGMEADLTNKEHSAIDPCVHLKWVGDDYPNGFSHGRTMRNSQTTRRFKYERQQVEETENSLEVVTLLKEERGSSVEHHLLWHKGCEALEVKTVIHNNREETIALEMITSFSIGGLTPLDPDEASGSLKLHRMRSTWCMEGRLETRPVEEFQLEPSWANYSANSIRFGQVGSMPVRGFFPFLAAEDTKKGVVWAAQLAHPASWQMEAYSRDLGLCLSGGLADREFGHWVKHVRPGHSFATPSAYLTVVRGDVDAASQRLTAIQELPLRNIPESERDLPVIFNEYCTTWGKPSSENISKIAKRLKEKGIRYFVIDCGWYSEDGKNWESNMGDWEPNPTLFPNGIEQTVDEIRSCGMIPGIWFEFEICGREARAFHQTDHLLKRDGVPITTGNRRFWDFRDPWTVDYLTEKVIGTIKRYGFGYLKIDYNDNPGIGCDGAESLGEGLREQAAAVQRFIRKIRAEVPDLVIENCSSGGHRLEPSMMAISSMASFSDAHETPDIPIIAANVHRAILPRQSQIWAVIRKGDTPQRMVYSLAATMLGRMCLSGDVHQLDERQWKLVDQGIAFYRSVAPIIKEGFTYRFGPEILSYRHPEGWQAIVRVKKDRSKAMIVIHTFGGEQPDRIHIPIPENLKCVSCYSEHSFFPTVVDGSFSIQGMRSFQGMAFLLEQEPLL